MPKNIRVLGGIPHRQIGLPVRTYDACTFVRVAQVQCSPNEIELLAADGGVQIIHCSEVRGRYIYEHQMELLLGVAGFAQWEIYGDFDRRLGRARAMPWS